ncbi:glucose-1-phosphate thymidylyltransferase [Platysternon megacephalum]|uniref:TNF receptor-associated factor n=1 Tax=Platysternon megacephalum TaxID=55544 RepID=A0A4D9DKN0_9SAUR|nr:glucose-1-phosphate thymidylyltransferase [Platysternon megacephalum]
MSSLIFSPWGSAKLLSAPSPTQQGEPAGSPGGAPGASEGGSRCDWCEQLAEQGHRRDCGHHVCEGCERDSSRAGILSCLQCLEDQEKQLLNDLDRQVHHQQLGTVEEGESLAAPSHRRLVVEVVQGPQEAPGRLDQRLDEVEAQQKTLQNIVTVLSREMGRREGARGSANRGSANVLGEAMARILYLEEKVAKQDTLLALKDVMISNLGARVEALEQTSYNGQFLWRLPDVGRKMQQALSRQTPAVYSPPFYTGRYGYKLCLKVYLNGDGTGAGTHISLFLVLMRGEYDFWLKWPFHLKVTFTLLDQVGEHHVSSSFRPSAASSSFQRPVSKCNIASGIPEFFPLCQLHAPGATYIHEDTLAFEAVIGDTNL